MCISLRPLTADRSRPSPGRADRPCSARPAFGLTIRRKFPLFSVKTVRKHPSDGAENAWICIHCQLLLWRMLWRRPIGLLAWKFRRPRPGRPINSTKFSGRKGPKSGTAYRPCTCLWRFRDYKSAYVFLVSYFVFWKTQFNFMKIDITAWVLIHAASLRCWAEWSLIVTRRSHLTFIAI